MPGALSGKMADYAPWKKEWSWMIHSKVDAVLEVRKVFGSPIKLDVSARSAAARERSAYNHFTWSKSGDKYVKTFAKPRNVVGIRPQYRKPAKKEAVVRHDVKLTCKACATTKNYEPISQRKRPIFSGTWEARKPSNAEVEVEAILKKISQIRKEAELYESLPVGTDDSVKEEMSKVTAEVRPAAGDDKEETVSSVREVGSEDCRYQCSACADYCRE